MRIIFEAGRRRVVFHVLKANNARSYRQNGERPLHETAFAKQWTLQQREWIRKVPFKNHLHPSRANSDRMRAIIGELRWSRLSEQFFRIDKWSVCRG
jgi:hypothetical protein